MPGHPGGRDAGAGGDIKLDGGASVARPFDGTAAPLGASCTDSRACASGQCVEGICCDSACSGGCQTCSAPGALGTCLARAAGSQPRQLADCPVTSPASCGLDGTCDGAGACRFYLGTTCLPGSCLNGAVTGAEICDGEGNCRPGPTLICAPYDCDSAMGQCRVSCANDGDCLDGQPCHSGACGDPRPPGPCGANEDCASGFCADGVCCNTACGGTCVSCALPGRVGTCSPLPVGATCAGSSCSGTLWSGPGSCDGAGTCQRQMVPCTPYACNPQTNACHDFCATADDCAQGMPCLNGSCGNPPPAACSADAECASGFCAQGACCTTKCDGPCFSCALPGTLGTCMPVPNPPDAGACAP